LFGIGERALLFAEPILLQALIGNAFGRGILLVVGKEV